MRAHVEGLDVHAALVLGIRPLLDGLHKLVGDVEDVRAALRRVDRVDKGDL